MLFTDLILYLIFKITRNTTHYFLINYMYIEYVLSQGHRRANGFSNLLNLLFCSPCKTTLGKFLAVLHVFSVVHQICLVSMVN